MTLPALPTKTQLGIGTAVLVVTFALGRYSKSTAPEIKTAETTKTQEHDNKDTNTKTHTVTVAVKKPDGETQTTTTTDTTTIADITKTIQSDETKKTDVIPPKANLTNISMLVGDQFTNPLVPLYGVSVTHQVWGPLTVGAFGFTNSTVGVSVGLSF
jgi:uncharacterized membrane protein YdfJ with MMPL/SSD domain